MKITKKVGGLMTFMELKDGDWFIDDDGDVGIKITNIYANYNCIYFGLDDNYCFADASDEDYVCPVEVELVVTNAQ